MGKNRDFISFALSGKQAKRRIKNCPNTNTLINCYLGVSECFNNSSAKHIGGLYKKISGDINQPDAFRIEEDHNYIYYDKQGNTIYSGNHPKAINSVGYNSKHYNAEGVLISSTIIITDVNTTNGTEATTKGEAFMPGKFNNSNYVGKYTAKHTYRYIFDELNNCKVSRVIYTNNYNFENGKTSSASYLLQNV